MHILQRSRSICRLSIVPIRTFCTTLCGSKESLSTFVQQLQSGKIDSFKSTLATKSSAMGVILLTSPHVSGKELKGFHQTIWDTFSQFNNVQLIGGVVDVLFPSSQFKSIDWSVTIIPSGNNNVKDIVAVASGSAETSYRKFKSVGRWPEWAPSGNSVNASSWNPTIFQSVSSPPKSQHDVKLPHAFNKDETSLILSLSDSEPYEWMETMSKQFNRASKIGLITSPTPFITGKSNTLFFNNEILDSGSASLLINSSSKSTHLKVDATDGIKSVISNRMRIERCQGNIILELSSGSASKVLLDHATSTPDGLFAIRVFRDKEEVIFRITGGDLAKGTLCIDTVEDLHVGDEIELLRLADNIETNREFASQSMSGTISFHSLPEHNDLINTHRPVSPFTEIKYLSAGSYSGFFYGHSNASLHTCNIPRSCASIF